MEQGLGIELAQATAIYQQVVSFFVNYSFQLLGAAVILLLGIVVARKVAAGVFTLCQKKNIDITLSRFIASTVRITVIVMVAIMALSKLGISVTPVLAAVGALSLGAGLAVQGLLSNYGAGFNIILTRPFVVGDTITVQGVTGIVKEVHLAYTLLSNEDKVEVLIPNRHIVGEIIHNSHGEMVIELSVGIAYHCDPEPALTAIQKALAALPEVSQQRPPQVGIEEFGDSAIVLAVRLWAPTEHFFESRYRANQAIYSALKAHNIAIPFPQRDVRLVTGAEGA